MDFVGSVCCEKCGSPVGTSSGRCPFCGEELSKARGANVKKRPGSEAAPVGYSEGALRYKKPGVSKKQQQRELPIKPVLLSVGAFSFLIGGVVLFTISRGANPSAQPVVEVSPARREPAKAPDEISVPEPKHVDPAELSAAVQHRARSWNPSARLLSISASPVVETHVDLEAPDGKIVFTYASGKQDPALAPSPNLGQFVVTVEKNGPQQASFPAGPGDAKALVDEPLCVFSAAIRAGRASGIPAEATIEARYDLDSVLKRAMWKLTVPNQKEHTRYIDGQSCAIVTRR